MIDLHCHILPGVDDGAQSLEEAAAMCRLAARDGCEAMVATPHQRRGEWWNADREALSALADELQDAVGPGFRVYLGGEVHVDSELLAEVEKLPGGGVLPLAGSRYLLIEFDSLGTAKGAIHLVHELSVAGWRPIIAHPEFIPWLAPDPSLLARLISLGATVQVTAMSVTGDFGRRPQNDVFTLLDAGLVHFVASDSHGIRRRPPGLGRAHRLIAGRWGADVAQRLVADHPRAVVADLPLPAVRAAE
ncbi:MAG TPA: CpsB/CapC family capsule biosynthesis tyrosine phosphatase [Thermoanaerobaculia bacterium]|jgi:protein-tyrosine phosphatase|nr:CpsB/CapC family capsule biosynthesis tyrosine phosphatase [Thermoanaerobaculia bacterium]